MNRLWWIIAVGLSVLFCITSISKLSLDWLGSPARTSTENPMPISAIPFPTTTICREIKVHANNVNMTADQFDDASCGLATLTIDRTLSRFEIEFFPLNFFF